MIKFADELDFENAAKIRDKIKELKAWTYWKNKNIRVKSMYAKEKIWN